MSVVVSIEDVGPCRKQLRIEVPQPAVEAETQRVVVDYRRRVRLPGFRKGKVPAGMITQRFRKEIEQEVVDRLVPRYWRQAEAEQQLDPLAPPELAGVDFSLGEGMTFTAVVETRPRVELGDLDHFQLPAPPPDPGDEEIEQQLEELRRRAGAWKPVDRPAARGDRALVVIRSGDKEPQKVAVEVGDERVWEELTLAVTGLAAGQSSQFRRGTQEGAEPEELQVTVEEVQELEPAPADDELARKVSQFETFAELREQVGENLRQSRRRDYRRQQERALLAQLRDRYPLELPRGVVDSETEEMVREYAHQLSHRGVDVERSGIDWGAIAEQLRPEAERTVHSRLLVDAIAEQRGIEVPEERLEEVLTGIAHSRQTSAQAVRRELDQRGQLGALRKQLRREATVRDLLRQGGGVESDRSD
ncbi:MAG TPA: trigger factor [Thermoanaerobaculia bacterium]|nr:trigger factor [Thermoanaerobaculia bacterium]